MFDYNLLHCLCTCEEVLLLTYLYIMCAAIYILYLV